MEALRSIGKQALQEGCQHPENGKACGRPLSGTAWKYCDLHRKAGQQEAKKQRDKADKALYRKHYRLEDNHYHFLYYRGLTEKQLEPLFKNAESLREQWPSLQDDIHQFAIDKLKKIKQPLFTPATDLPSSAHAAIKQTIDLLEFLETQQAYHASLVTDRLIVYAKELLCGIGMGMSRRTFIIIGRHAEEVREMWRVRGDLLNLVHAIFVEVELCRQQLFVMPYRRQLWEKARRWLKAAASICDLYTGEQKQTSDFLGFYAESGELRLAFDADNRSEAAHSIQSLQRRANAIADAYGTGPLVERVIFLASINQAEYHLRLKETDLAHQYFKNAEQTSSDMNWCSLEVHESIAHLRAAIAMARNDYNREEYMQEYINTFLRYPSLEHRRNLRELKQLYGKDVPDMSRLNGVPCYVDLIFRHLDPILLYV